MRGVVIAVLSIVGGAEPARADRVGPAADLSLAFGSGTQDVSTDGGLYARLGAGLQLGRVAVLAHIEEASLTPPDPSLDSSDLDLHGKGASVRVELLRRRDLYLHLSAGYTWRRIDGEDSVRRACTVFGGCDAGFYTEVPEYTDHAPWVALSFGVRSQRRIWPALGAELGVTPIAIDRSAGAPDEHGAMVWLGLNVSLGSN